MKVHTFGIVWFIKNMWGGGGSWSDTGSLSALKITSQIQRPVRMFRVLSHSEDFGFYSEKVGGHKRV
jgi:hypothetical protein